MVHAVEVLLSSPVTEWTPKWYRTDNKYYHGYGLGTYSASSDLRQLINRMRRLGGFIQRVGWQEYLIEWHGTETKARSIYEATDIVCYFELKALDLIKTIVEDCRA